MVLFNVWGSVFVIIICLESFGFFSYLAYKQLIDTKCIEQSDKYGCGG